MTDAAEARAKFKKAAEPLRRAYFLADAGLVGGGELGPGFATVATGAGRLPAVCNLLRSGTIVILSFPLIRCPLLIAGRGSRKLVPAGVALVAGVQGVRHPLAVRRTRRALVRSTSLAVPDGPAAQMLASVPSSRSLLVSPVSGVKSTSTASSQLTQSPPGADTSEPNVPSAFISWPTWMKS